MQIKLVNKLVFSFLLVMIFAIILGFHISNYAMKKNFEDYLIDKNDNMIEVITEALLTNYDTDEGVLYFRDIKLLAKSQGLYIKVEDVDGVIISETSKDYLRIENTYDYIEENYDLVKNDHKIGVVTIGYYGFDNCDTLDLEMKDTIREVLVQTAVVTLFIGIIICIFLARHISTPLIRFTQIADEIRKGNLKVCSDIKSSTYEINQLSNAINYLVKTLENEDMLRKRLTSDIAHEIRTPLTTIQNTLEAFLYGVWKPSEERIRSCYEEVRRLSKLVDKLKDIEKLEEANMFLNISKFNFTEEMKQIYLLFKKQYENKNMDLVLHCDEEIMITSDKDKLKQVIINLLNNAYNYTNEGKSVEVFVNDLEDSFRIAIEDRGIGISSEDLPFIFERFYRADEARHRKTGGTGIGLTITKALVNNLGGKINVKSQLGKGSLFTVIIPKSNE